MRDVSITIKHPLNGFDLDVSITLRPGITALLGPSGSGKSTIADMVAGLRKPNKGHIAFGKHVLSCSHKRQHLSPQKRRVGYVFQNGELFPHMTVRENIAYGNRDGDNLVALCQAFEIDHLLDQHPQNISGGEKRRVAIVRALASKPDILIFDEALNGLDGPRKKRLYPHFLLLKQQFKGPILFITHQFDEVLELADDVLLLEKGCVKQSGPLRQLVGDESFLKSLHLPPYQSVLSGIYKGTSDALSHVQIGDLDIYTTPVDKEPDEQVYLHVDARDISIALSTPKETSILNILPVVIDEIQPLSSHSRLITLSFGHDAQHLKAMISAKSCDALNLQTGMSVFALLKALSVLK